MGRHSAPGTGEPQLPARLLSLGVLAAAVLGVLAVVAFVAFRGDGGGGLTVSAQDRTGSPTASSSSTNDPATTDAATSTSPPPSAPATPGPTTKKRPATVDLRLTGDSYVTIRRADGSTILSQLLHEGAHKVYDDKYVRVVLGNAAAVQVTINGKRVKPGAKGQVLSFVAQRR